MSDVGGPGEVSRDVNPKDLEPLYLLSVHAEGRELCAFGFPEIHNQLLGFRGFFKSKLMSERHSVRC